MNAAAVQSHSVAPAPWRPDLQLIAPDLALGVVYVLAGFFLIMSSPHLPVVPLPPFLLAALVMIYLTWRLTADARTESTAAFYFNQPQARAVACRRHLAILAASVALLECVILTGLALQLNHPAPSLGYKLSPLLFIIPPLAAALTLWYNYYRPPLLNRWVLLVAAILLTSFIVFVTTALSRPAVISFNLLTWLHRTLIVLLVALTFAAAWHARRHWLNLQIGEIL